MSELSETLTKLDRQLTPGEWTVFGEALMVSLQMDATHHIMGVIGKDGFGGNMGWNLSGIATLRNLLPTLIAAEAERERLREALDELEKQWTPIAERDEVYSAYSNGVSHAYAECLNDLHLARRAALQPKSAD